MKDSTKYIILAVVVVFIIVSATLQISGWFKRDKTKSEYIEAKKAAEKSIEENLRYVDSLKIATTEQMDSMFFVNKIIEKELQLLKETKIINRKQYEKFDNYSATDKQLDSLPAEFWRKYNSIPN